MLMYVLYSILAHNFSKHILHIRVDVVVMENIKIVDKARKSC